MIKRVKYQEINWEKYQKCLEESEQYLFFAEKKYLDLLIGENWEIIIDGDYNAVMPVPKVKKYGLDFVLMPSQTQQLGIFSKNDNPKLNDLFYQFLKQKYRVFYYAFNAKNTFSFSTEKRKNFVLGKNNYDFIRQQYSVHRRRNVRILDTVKDKIRFVEAENIDVYRGFFEKNLIGFDDKKDIQKAFSNMLLLFEKKLLKVYNLFFDDNLASQAYLLEAPKEQFLINFINDKSFLKYNSTSIILDQIFKINIDKKAFNFHGSNLQEIAEFYRRFGAKEEQYAFIKQNKKQLLLSVFK